MGMQCYFVELNVSVFNFVPKISYLLTKLCVLIFFDNYAEAKALLKKKKYMTVDIKIVHLSFNKYLKLKSVYSSNVKESELQK